MKVGKSNNGLKVEGKDSGLKVEKGKILLKLEERDTGLKVEKEVDIGKKAEES